MSSRIVPTEAVSKYTPSSSPPKRTFAAFQHPAFRLFFLGQLVSVSGTWMQTVAQQIVVYDMTRSELALGLVACAQGLPTLLLTPLAGVLVERFPRRILLIISQSIMMLLAFMMALLYATQSLAFWHIILLSLGLGIANALDAPARLTFVVEMVGKEDLPSALSMNSTMFNMARIVGPALGGIALSALGAGWCFFLNGLSFLAVLFSLVVMRFKRIVSAQKPPKGIWRPLAEGVRFARHHATIAPLLLLSALTSTFGLTFTVLLPPFGEAVFGSATVGTSVLLLAQGIGALTASLYVARITNGGQRGRLLTFGAILAPISVMLISQSQALFVAAAFSILAGFGFISQFVLTNTLIQTEVPDEFRGRVLSLYTLTFFGLTPFGSLIIGLIGNGGHSVSAMLFFGALSLIGAALILWRAPQVSKLP